MKVRRTKTSKLDASNIISPRLESYETNISTPRAKIMKNRSSQQENRLYTEQKPSLKFPQRLNVRNSIHIETEADVRMS